MEKLWVATKTGLLTQCYNCCESAGPFRAGTVHHGLCLESNKNPLSSFSTYLGSRSIDSIRFFKQRTACKVQCQPRKALPFYVTDVIAVIE